MSDQYGIIKVESTYTEGDERSKTHPGHGYPGGYSSSTVLREYKTKEEWEKEIERLANPRYGRADEFRAIIFREVKVTTSVSVNIE